MLWISNKKIALILFYCATVFARRSVRCDYEYYEKNKKQKELKKINDNKDIDKQSLYTSINKMVKKLKIYYALYLVFNSSTI